jgi:putative transposase
MAREWRIEYKGAPYHVLSRGNEQRNLVSEDRDRHLFLDTLNDD